MEILGISHQIASLTKIYDNKLISVIDKKNYN
jgi:hypothetical protein